ncbi:AraC family transcriptional regulator [Deinococcus sp. AJ005]|uniref:helix-turn-helix domain-containing protein n=1 Tax=Deinococcus sp. AJ005 TaxID=2652443 RepID=UPI00125CC472|nr:AraC family transcriptional regulator [Deinococcus sp. AJ005]QFP76094.1 AraC family transcriptional regulator [Deinococcus sp. AJ005]
MITLPTEAVTLQRFAGAQDVFFEVFEGFTLLGHEAQARPHRHAYHEVLWIESGLGQHSVDGVRVELSPQTLSVITAGQTHEFHHVQEVNGALLCLEPELWRAAPILSHAPADWAIWRSIWQVLGSEYARSTQHLPHALRESLALALRLLEREQIPAAPDRAASRLARFQALLEHHFRTEHEVAFYAAQLHCTSDQLSREVRVSLGHSAKNAIQQRLMLEAQRLLRLSSLPVGQVAERLGYRDVFSFSRAFRSGVGVSPQGFRRPPSVGTS